MAGASMMAQPSDHVLHKLAYLSSALGATYKARCDIHICKHSTPMGWEMEGRDRRTAPELLGQMSGIHNRSTSDLLNKVDSGKLLV